MLLFRYTDRTDYKSLHALAHALLHECMIREYGKDFIVTPDEYGKPRVENNIFYVSLTHCSGMFAAMTAPVPCGIDAESIRKVSPAALKRVFSEKERQLVENAAHPEHEFTRLWTLKEAYSKAVGRGMAVMKNIDFCDISPNAEQYKFSFNTFYLENHILSVCTAKERYYAEQIFLGTHQKLSSEMHLGRP